VGISAVSLAGFGGFSLSLGSGRWAAACRGNERSPSLTQTAEVEKPSGFSATPVGAIHCMLTNHTKRKRKNGNAKALTSVALPKAVMSRPRARRTMSYYAGNDTAEMATVLRRNATILIRLREKMEVHLCTVFHSTCNPIILKRNATKLRMLQDHDKNQSLNFTQAI